MECVFRLTVCGWGSDRLAEPDEGAAPAGRARYKRGRPDYGGRASRYRGAAGAAGPVIDGAAEPVAGTREGAPLSPGQRVFHQKFGYGRIVAVEGDRLEVDFEQTALKKIMASFVERA